MFKHLPNLSKVRRFLPLALTMLLLQAQAQTCQTILEDFESNRQVTNYSLSLDGTLVQNEPNTATSGVNTSAVCGKYTSSANEASIILKINKIKNANLFRSRLLRFTIDVKSPNIGYVKMLLKKAGPVNTGLHTLCEVNLESSQVNTWTTLNLTAATWYTADNTAFADSIAEIQLVLPSYGSPVYFDNITVTPHYTSIDNFDSERNATLKLAQGTINAAFANSSTNNVNSSSKCATFRKAAGNANAAVWYSLPSGVSVARLKSGAERFALLLYSVASPVPVKVSLLDTNVTPHAVHSVYEGKPTVESSGTWGYAYPTLKSQGTVSDIDVDVVALEIDPGVIATTLYRFDDFMVYSYVPYAPLISGAASPCVGTNPYDYTVPTLTGVNYEWAVNAAGTIVSGGNSNKAQIVFNAAPTALQSRYVVQGGCASPWGNLKFSNTNLPATITAKPYYTSTTSACQGKSTQLEGTFTGSNTALWSSSGTGTFTSTDAKSTYYTPSQDDADLGVVDIRYTTVGGNCGTKSSAISFNILPAPAIADITPDMELCITQGKVTVSAITNGPKVHWYGYNSAGFSPVSPVNSGASVTYTLDSYEKTLGNTIQLKAETDYSYACGHTSKTVNIKLVGTSASPVTTTRLCHSDTVVRVFRNSVGTNVPVWSSTTGGLFLASDTSAIATYKITDQDRAEGVISIALTSTTGTCGPLVRNLSIPIEKKLLQPTLDSLAPLCVPKDLQIDLAPATGSPTITYRWQTSGDKVSWISPTSQTTASYTRSLTGSEAFYLRRVAVSAQACSTATNAIYVKSEVPVGNNTVSGSATFCYGTYPVGFIGSTPTGQLAKAPYFQWQKASLEDSTSFTDIPNATKGSYVPAISANSEFFRRIVYAAGACTNSVSNVVKTTVQQCPGISCTVSKTFLCAGEEFTTHYSTTGLSFPVGNTFTAQLIYNGFVAISNIGSIVSSDTSGQITCRIAGISSSSQFRIRVVASDPTLTSYEVRNITLNEVTGGFTTNASNVVIGTQVILTNTVKNLVSSTWQLGQGAVYEHPLPLLNPSYYYNTTGTKSINLIATDANGCTKTINNSVGVFDYNCAPKTPAGTIMITGNVKGTPPQGSHIWVRAGATYTLSTSAFDTIYVSSGAKLIMDTLVSAPFVYLEPNASFDAKGMSSKGTVVYSPNAVLINPKYTRVLCNLVNINGLITDDDVAYLTEATLQVFPNPSIGGTFSIKTSEQVLEVSLSNSLGITETFGSVTEIKTTMKGLLVATIKTAHQTYTRKISVLE